jgi:hypothetical protein
VLFGVQVVSEVILPETNTMFPWVCAFGPKALDATKSAASHPPARFSEVILFSIPFLIGVRPQQPCDPSDFLDWSRQPPMTFT